MLGYYRGLNIYSPIILNEFIILNLIIRSFEADHWSEMEFKYNFWAWNVQVIGLNWILSGNIPVNTWLPFRIVGVSLSAINCKQSWVTEKQKYIILVTWIKIVREQRRPRIQSYKPTLPMAPNQLYQHFLPTCCP